MIYRHVLKSADVPGCAERTMKGCCVVSGDDSSKFQEFVLSRAIQRSSDVQRTSQTDYNIYSRMFKILVSSRRSNMSSCFQWGLSEREVSGLSFRCKLSRQDFLLVAFSFFFFFFVLFKKLCYITWAVNRDNRCPQLTPEARRTNLHTKKIHIWTWNDHLQPEKRLSKRDCMWGSSFIQRFSEKKEFMLFAKVYFNTLEVPVKCNTAHSHTHTHTLLIWRILNWPFVSLCRDNTRLQQAILPSSFHVSLSVGLVQTCPHSRPIRGHWPATGGQWAPRHDRGSVNGAALRARLHVWCNRTWFTGE